MGTELSWSTNHYHDMDNGEKHKGDQRPSGYLNPRDTTESELKLRVCAKGAVTG